MRQKFDRWFRCRTSAESNSIELSSTRQTCDVWIGPCFLKLKKMLLLTASYASQLTTHFITLWLEALGSSKIRSMGLCHWGVVQDWIAVVRKIVYLSIRLLWKLPNWRYFVHILFCRNLTQSRILVSRQMDLNKIMTTNFDSLMIPQEPCHYLSISRQLCFFC